MNHRFRWGGKIRQWLLRFSILSLTTLGMALFLEQALGWVNYLPIYSSQHPVGYLDQADWWVCDLDLGCRIDNRYTKSWIAAHPDNPIATRLQLINNQGYHDADEFTATNLPNDVYKILGLGDSFTWGASADLGQSWLEILEKGLNQQTPTLIWNMGIPTVGTEQALALLEHYAPIMQPDLVILGVYHNDFYDNMLPLDAFYITEDGKFIQQYVVAQDLTPIRFTPEAAYLRTTGVNVARNDTERQLGHTRLGSGLLRLYYRFTYGRGETVIDRGYDPDGWEYPPDWATQYHAEALRRMEDYLSQIAAYTAQRDIQFLILVIPRKSDVIDEDVGRFYRDLQTILAHHEDWHFADPLSELTPESYNQNDDEHWNNKGHEIVGQWLLECLLPLVQNQQLLESCPS